MAIVLFIASAALAQSRNRQLDGTDAARVKEITPMIGAAKIGFGRPIGDREAWNAAIERHNLRRFVAPAEKLIAEPIAPFSRELFLEFSKSGNRLVWERQNAPRVRRLQTLAMAECIENQGRFLPALEEAVRAHCSDPTWLLSACDLDLANLEGKRIDIDLGAAMMAWRMGTIYHVLGEKLSPEVRKIIEDELRRRIFEPYREMVEGRDKAHWWLKGENNWNAVCLGGVTGAALAVVDSPEERAWFVAAAEQYIAYFLKSFTPDGYCTEGLGYWNYGYGHFLMLTEAVYLATDGKVDFLKLEGAALPGELGARFEILNGRYPAFADCSPDPRPSANYMFYVNRRLGLGLENWEESRLAPNPGVFYEAMLFAFPNSATRTLPAKLRTDTPGIRTYFDHVGILIARSGANGPANFAAALKGGSNGEVHNHNDVGTFMVVSERSAPLTDPGSEVYTRRTFSAQRYESNVINSFGHAVPRIAGQLQRTGAQARARVLKTDFTDVADTFTMDIRSAYDVPELSKLERTFVYSRAGKGALEIIDEVAFISPETFETALITYGDFERKNENTLFISDFESAVEVVVDTGGLPFEIEAVQIEEDVHHPSKPMRVAVRLQEPVEKARVAMSVRPVDVTDLLESSGLLINGGFERNGRGWRINDRGMSSIVTEPVRSGQYALRIADDQADCGSDVVGLRVPAQAGMQYVLKGWIYPISGGAKDMQGDATDYKGLGMYVRYLNEDGEILNERTGLGYNSLGSLGGNEKEWKPFALPFATPAGTTHIQVWIHSYNAARVEAVLDDLEIVEAGR